MLKFKYIFILAMVFQGCSTPPVSFEKASFDDLKTFEEQNFEKSKQIFTQNCITLSRRNGENLAGNALFGSISQWKTLCQNHMQYDSFERFLKENFDVYKVKSQKEGLFTGYYTPYIEGSLTQTETYNTPVYGIPENMYTIDLGEFNPELKGQRIVARIDETRKRIVPYAQRAEIESTAVPSLAIVWLKSPVDAFFLHIQGSGYIKLENGDVFHAAFAGSNGHTYKAIGGTLIQKGYMKREDVTMQSIQAWLEANPSKQSEIFNSNPRYIFFGKGNGQSTGSFGVPLTAGKSLAVDPKYIPLGIPVFLDSSVSLNGDDFKSIMYTHDTGAAIVGELRGDIYFGAGENAELLAGAQKASGSMYVFVPKKKIQ